MIQYGKSIVDATSPGFSAGAQAAPAFGRPPGDKPGDWNVDVPPLLTYVVLMKATDQYAVHYQKHRNKLMRNWPNCGCEEECWSWVFVKAVVTIEGGSDAENRALEEALAGAFGKLVAKHPKLRNGEPGECSGRIEGGDCAERCGVESTPEDYRIPVSGQVRRAGGAAAGFLGYLYFRLTIISILYRGLPLVPNEPRDPPPPRRPVEAPALTPPSTDEGWGRGLRLIAEPWTAFQAHFSQLRSARPSARGDAMEVRVVGGRCGCRDGLCTC